MKLTSYFFVGIFVTCMHSYAQMPVYRRVWNTIEGYSVDSFVRANATGSMILSGTCQSSTDGDPVFTGFIVDPPATPIVRFDDALNFVSHVQPHFSWSRQQNGMVQIRDDRALGAILGIHLERVEIVDAVDISEALNKFLSTKEINKFLTQTHTQLMRVSSSNEIFGSNPESESVSSSSTPKHSLIIKNLTVREALNSIVHDFNGVWVYSECPGQISIRVFPTGIPSFWTGGPVIK